MLTCTVSNASDNMGKFYYFTDLEFNYMDSTSYCTPDFLLVNKKFYVKFLL